MYWKFSPTILVVSHFLSAKVSWMEVKSGFRNPKNVSLSPEQKCLLKKGTNVKIMWTFLRDQILCPLNRGLLKDRFHCRAKAVKIVGL